MVGLWPQVARAVALPYRGAPGGHAIEIKIYHDADRVMLEFKDNGLAFNPLHQQAPQLGLPVAETPVGGLGLPLIRQLSDELNYHRQGNYNILSLQWNKQGQTGQDPVHTLL